MLTVLSRDPPELTVQLQDRPEPQEPIVSSRDPQVPQALQVRRSTPERPAPTVRQVPRDSQDLREPPVVQEPQVRLDRLARVPQVQLEQIRR